MIAGIDHDRRRQHSAERLRHTRIALARGGRMASPRLPEARDRRKKEERHVVTLICQAFHATK